MNGISSDRAWMMELRVKNLLKEVASFKSGEKYIQMEAEKKRIISAFLQNEKHLKKALAASRMEIKRVRDIWIYQYYEECEKTQKLKTQIAKLKQKLKVERLEKYKIGEELMEEQEKNKKLTAMLRRDSENSSIPSSKDRPGKTVHNTRQKTGRKKGAQKGHAHHPRRKQQVTSYKYIEPEKRFLDESKYRPTGKIVKRQLLSIRMFLDVTEYETPEFIEKASGRRLHSAFPNGVTDDVNYDGRIRSFLFLLNHYCNVSIPKCSKMLAEMTGGKLTISAGMISRLSSDFAGKTKAERERCFAKLLSGETMHADFTNAKVDGASKQVLICSAGEDVLFLARNHKGHKGIEDSPVAIYKGTLIHDHDTTMYAYGGRHQECLSHVIRYLIGSIQMEPSLTWNVKMLKLLRKMLRQRRSLSPEEEMDTETAERFRERYAQILALGEKEYTDNPPGKYYRDGYNLHKRMKEYQDAHMLFLKDRNIEPTNNEAERYARLLKRKLHQVTTFRSFKGLENYCMSLGVIETLRNKKENLFESAAVIFDQ